MEPATDPAVARTPAAPNPLRPRPFRVLRTKEETRDTFTIALEPPPPEKTFSFRPGQFNMLYAFGTGEVPISMSGRPGETREVIHTIRAVGPVTRELRKLRKGDALGVRGPFGTAWPVEAAEGRDVVLVAGGIGLAPLRPALYHILAERDRYGRVVLLFGARTPEDILFARELETWRGRFDIDVEIIVDRAARGWHGLVGVVTSLVPRAPFDPRSAMAFVCGPEIMMSFAVFELKRRGIPTSDIHVSMERNMKCAVGFCGHCQFGPEFVCKDGPVLPFARVGPYMLIREL